jgi:hypothetical protein
MNVNDVYNSDNSVHIVVMASYGHLLKNWQIPDEMVPQINLSLYVY